MSVPVFPLPRFTLNRLVALEDREGFVVGFGSVLGIDHQARQVTLLTPLRSLERVVSLKLGVILLDPAKFRDQKINSQIGR
jgi:polynucleotide 5'-kinase involved in rRNA processing